MLGVFVFIFLALAAKHGASSFEIVKRAEWGALPPKAIEYINKTVPYVLIHHSHSPPACFTQETCSEAMRSMQRFHQNDRGWWDIGYTFAIGGDGKVYEGRGFNVVGAHSPKYNDISIGICLIGNWEEVLPPQNMLDTTHAFVAYAVKQGYLAEDYKLIGHRQVRDTTCPGQTLYEEIEKWPHFDAEEHEIVVGTVYSATPTVETDS